MIRQLKIPTPSNVLLMMLWLVLTVSFDLNVGDHIQIKESLEFQQCEIFDCENQKGSEYLLK